MPPADSHLSRLETVTGFDLAIRHCPKCGWVGAASETVLRFCGPQQRVEDEWHETVMFLAAETGTCDGPGEHFHWRCARCHYRRVLPVPRRTGSEAN